jgi:uncharacterized RDD family membrane protein YckC
VEYGDRARIATAEGVELELELAGMGSRGSARVIDVLLQFVILIVVWIIFGVSVGDSGLSDALIAVIGTVTTFVVIWGYDTLFEAFNAGQTPGKRRLSIRVVSEAGGGLTFRMAAIRNVLRIVDEGTLLIAAFISIARSPRNQRLGDMAAGTLVIRESKPAQRAELQLRESSWRLLEQAGAWDTTAIGADDLSTIRQFLDRRADLPPDRRRELADGIAGRLHHRVPGSGAATDSEQFLEVVAALKARRG